MLPKNTVVTNYLALEYDALLRGAILVKVEHHKASKIFRLLFKGESKRHLKFSFAPPQFLLLPSWTKSDESFEVWQECASSTVIGVTPLAGNRAIVFEIEKADEATSPRQFKIIFELFGAQANAFLIDHEGTILHALRVVKDNRRLRPGTPYVSAESLGDTSRAGQAEIASVAGISYLLEFDGKRHSIVTEPLTKLELDRKTPLVSLFWQLHDVQAAQQELRQAQATALGILKREIKKSENTLAQLRQDLAECAEIDHLKQWGDLLMANLDIKPEDNKLRVADLYHDDRIINVPLLAGKSILETAATYYKRAKRLQRMPAIVMPRIQKLEQTIAKLHERSTAVHKASDIDQLRKLVATFRTSSPRGKGPDTGNAPDSSPHYRTFYSSAGEKLLVGKSAAGNNVLTFKVARTYDWWFHAQQATGSHVILVATDKNRAPSKRSITEAAQLAAYYSDMKKSNNVPVMYTERRHVRKVKGGAPGKAIFQQIKSIFVDPKLPPTAKED
jgi:predicted ribosome quality control (RQC) complex YloA/Tae2 family protein